MGRWRDFQYNKRAGPFYEKKVSPPTSTAFKINYSFISGVNYNIQIIASGRPEVFLKTSVVPNVTNFVTSSQTACTMDANAYNYSTAGFGQFSSTTTTSSATYTIPQFSIPSGNSSQYLFIWASGGRPTSDLDVLYISKIKITATPIVSFNLSSSASSITCGSTDLVTFTVNNGGSATPTGYTWNLGATPNGWLLNGSAAPATIPTLATQNTIQLTPVCGSTLSNVSATVTANGVNYTTNSSAVTVTLPDLSINGSDALCSGSSPYFINNLPCNAAVSWQATPSGIVTFGSPNDPQTSISPSGTGQVSITATITNVCGETVVKTKNIAVGIPSMSDGTFTKNGQLYPLAIFNSTNTLCQNVQSVVTGTWQSATSVVWSGPGYSHPSVWQDYGFNNTTKISTMQLHIYQTPGTGYWTVTGSNGCGSTSYTVAFDAAVCSGDPCTYYRVSPNPSKDGDIVIISKPAPIECPPIDPLITRVNIYDQNGTLIKTKLNGKTNNTSLQMPTTKKGFMIVEIVSGKHTEKHKIIVQ